MYRIFSYVTGFLEKNGEILEFKSRGAANQYLQIFLSKRSSQKKREKSIYYCTNEIEVVLSTASV
ncbi:hypothetical protein [Ligilactobacillus salivarius]|uniref:hypothetical protein n=1 Tax=Ligilactobacillus salivarius TaxID=1624 RepID=UPI000BAFC457|nr:hypothetical protein [Ligilactobacillus salivarius]PAY51332.1 hypothetical protein A8C43_09600 [Ligilactobacillus salivarius]PAY60481.1 hypothetical protein A8C45_09360 [Ligilactobacillus salivarius]PAY64256.1 hypothetical protein A8C48_10380 [Ligilactobacillus salivarius]